MAPLERRRKLTVMLEVTALYADLSGDPAPLEQVVAEIKGEFGPNDALTFAARTSLERSLGRSRSPTASGQAWHRLLGEAETALGDRHPALHPIREFAAHYLPAVGQPDEDTVATLRRELMRRRESLGVDHYLAHSIAIGLADALRERGQGSDLAEAIELARGEIAYRSIRYGEDHEVTWQARASLARALIGEVETRSGSGHAATVATGTASGVATGAALAEAVEIGRGLVRERGRLYRWASPQILEAHLIAAHALAAAGLNGDAAREAEFVVAATAGKPYLVDQMWLAHVRDLVGVPVSGGPCPPG